MDPDDTLVMNREPTTIPCPPPDVDTTGQLVAVLTLSEPSLSDLASELLDE
jgi:hypothetical protein